MSALLTDCCWGSASGQRIGYLFARSRLAAASAEAGGHARRDERARAAEDRARDDRADRDPSGARSWRTSWPSGSRCCPRRPCTRAPPGSLRSRRDGCRRRTRRGRRTGEPAGRRSSTWSPAAETLAGQSPAGRVPTRTGAGDAALAEPGQHRQATPSNSPPADSGPGHRAARPEPHRGPGLGANVATAPGGSSWPG